LAYISRTEPVPKTMCPRPILHQYIYTGPCASKFLPKYISRNRFGRWGQPCCFEISFAWSGTRPGVTIPGPSRLRHNDAESLKDVQFIKQQNSPTAATPTVGLQLGVMRRK